MLKKLTLLFFIVALCVSGSAFLLFRQVAQFIHQPLTITTNQLFTVEAGNRLDTVLHRMSEQGWIESSAVMPWVRRLHPELTHLRVGTFELHPGDSLQQALMTLIHGREHQFSITFVEGSRFRDWREALAKAPQLQHQINDMSDADIGQQLALKSPTLDGLFLPETYHYAAGMSDLDILRRAHTKLDSVLSEAWQARQQDLPFASPYEALILASIIEKETSVPDERRRVASVFVNRLNSKMRLQTDPTVIYGMGEAYTGNITKKDLRTPTPYNTYIINGLPPTPIAMPSAAAIQAALDPESSRYLYFVASGKGGHVFSNTLREHNHAVSAYLQQLRAQKK